MQWEVGEPTLIKVVNDKCSHYRRPRRIGLYSRERYLEMKRRKMMEAKEKAEENQL